MPWFYLAIGHKPLSVLLEFFNQILGRACFLIEFDPEVQLVYGWIDLDHGHPGVGHSFLEELGAIELSHGQQIERDLHYKPCRLYQVKSQMSHV